MAGDDGTCSKIRHVVRLRQIIRQWRDKARTRTSSATPLDVPSGHVAVYVGTSCRRFVVRAIYLNHPIFQTLLVKAEEEFGFENQGPLVIPCEESVFEESLRFISKSCRFTCTNYLKKNRHSSVRNNMDLWMESRPLIHGLSDNVFIW